MFDDTCELQLGQQGRSSPIPQAHLMQNISKIQSSSTIREHAMRWARSLRFLTFDDGPAADLATRSTVLSVASGDDGLIHGQCQPCSRKTPIPSGHMCHRHSANHNFEAREADLQSYANPCVHVREHCCEECRHIPLFPNESKVTRFRIRRVHQPDAKEFVKCDHFVAVSYCWSSESDVRKNEEPYQVVEEDGTVRNARAPKSTLDRVVNFARENGFRMIWIDQECIQQDNPAEKGLAIQAMDYVYVHAHTSIGLFHAQLEQKHLEALLLVYEAEISVPFGHRRGKSAFSGCRSVDVATMCEAVSKIADDKWNTRAWILQEAFASSGNMVLLFPRLENINTRGWMLVCHEHSKSELAIRLDVVQNCISSCTPMIRSVLRDPTSRTGPAKKRQSMKPNKDQMASQTLDGKRTMKRISLFHPRQPDSTGSYYLNNLKSRRTCNAAVALTYLKVRELENPADKIAIVANMCGYYLRLDTVELEKTQDSLAVCVLALALSNGDFSLLIPQMYRQPEATAPEFPLNNSNDFTWIHSLTRSMSLIEATEWNPFGKLSMDNAAVSIHLSEEGLSFPGFIWRKSHFVDLKRLQTKYARSWQNLHKRKGPLRSDQKTIRLATTHLFFEIIQALNHIGEKEVADSVLNSTSNWRWNQPPREWINTMIESVDQFPPGIKIENRKDMFNLNSRPNGGNHEDWIIDRVMNHGGLWVWAIDSTAMAERSPLPDDQVLTESSMATDIEGYITTSKQAAKAEQSTPKDGIQPTVAQYKKKPETPSTETENKLNGFVEKSHSEALGILNMMTKLVQFHTVDPPDEPDQKSRNSETEDIRKHLIRVGGAAAIFAISCAGIDSQEKNLAQRRAVFDIGEDTSEKQRVLTPFQMVLESIPRTEIRSMSVSWVVEETEKNTPGTDNRFRVTDMVKGMWRFVLEPGGRYTIV